MHRAVKVQGIECPFFREGDNIVDIVVDNVLKIVQKTSKEWYDYEGKQLDFPITTYNINDKDIIGITESVVARAAGQYITVDDIAADIEKKFGKDATICLVDPIYSRNRFSMILKGIARAAKKLFIVMDTYDEVGNFRDKNQFTGVNISEYYESICKEETCECIMLEHLRTLWNDNPNLIYKGVDYYAGEISGYIDCGLHLPNLNFSSLSIHSWNCFHPLFTLADVCSDVSPDWGVLGTNKATEEKLKLFPSKAECQRVCEEVKTKIKNKTGKDVIVCVYGDGCFKDPVGGIWEFADPVSMPGYTDKELIEDTPDEIKLKSIIDLRGGDNKWADSTIKEDIETYHSLKGNYKGQMGTTPRLYRDLLASLMDLTSGSGDRATPVVLVQNYF